MEDCKKIAEAVEQLSQKLAAEKKFFETSFRRTVILYGFLIIIVAGYTTFIVTQLEKSLTSENVAVMLNNHIAGMLPGMTQNLRDQMKPTAEKLAEQIVVGGHALIPQATAMAKVRIDEMLDEQFIKILASYKADYASEVESKTIEFLSRIDMTKNVAERKAFAKEIVDGINGKIYWPEADICNAINALNDDLNALKNTPGKRLTRQKLNERQLIMCWLSMVERTQKGGELDYLSNMSNLVYDISEGLTVKPAAK